METRFNFKSSICTSLEQSERLLALGLKKETADMTIVINEDGSWHIEAKPYTSWQGDMEYYPIGIPAWSLGRLLKLMPPSITGFYPFSLIYDIKNNTIGYMCANGVSMQSFKGINIFDNIIFAIKWLIEERYFNKEYLV